MVSATVRIGAAPSAVWDMVMDPARLADWVTIHRRLISADEGAPRVGFRMHQQIHLRGVSLDVNWKLVQCVVNERAVWDGRGPARSRARTEYSLRADGRDTVFDYRNEFRPPLGPVGAIVSRALVGGIPEREANRTLERLCNCLEGNRPG